MAFIPLDRSLLEASIPQAVLAQARLRPDAPAVIGDDATLTYRALAERSAVVASFLDAADAGLGPVPLLVEQSAELVATILGILRTGRPYVPLDAALSDARLRSILSDLEATSVVTGAAGAGRVGELGARPIIPHDSPPRQGWCDANVAANELAYIYFTSGTTGAAKGVMDTHRNVIHNVMRYVNGLEISSDDRLTLLQSPSFSGAVSSMFGALLSGACVFPYDVEKRGLDEVGAWLETHEITIYHSVPSLFRHVVNTERALESLRLVRLEGDRATPRDLAMFKQRFRTGCTLVNGLGATECGIVRRLFVEAEDETWDDESTVPVGHGIEDMDVRVEDEQGATVPPGGVGEIVVRSCFLSPGYWRQPELTAERFREEPEPGVRAYRTGDVGRLRPDGCLELLGRSDFRIRLHGKWLEADVVEHALRASTLVEDAVLATRERSSGEAVLVGFVVPRPGATPTAASLRQALAGTVAPHAIPREWAFLDALPLTANGKLDRQGLPLTARSRRGLSTPYAPPATAQQRLVVGLWQDVLEQQPVGIDDEFGELGGDSLSAAVVTSQLAKLTGAELPRDLLLRARTARLVAEHLEHARAPIANGTLFNDSGTSTPLVLLHGDYVGAGLYAARIADALAPNHPTLVLAPHHPEEPDQPQTVEQMAAAFRPRVEAALGSGPAVIAGYGHAGGLVAFELARELTADGFELARLVLIATVAPHPATRFLAAPVAITSRALRLSPPSRARLFAALRRAARSLARGWRRQPSWHPRNDTPSPAAWRVVVAGYGARRAPALAITHVSCLRDASPDPDDPGARWRALASETSTLTVDATSESIVGEDIDALGEIIRGELGAPESSVETGRDQVAPLRC